MKNVAIYYRVSTERQDLHSQKEAISGWLANLAVEKRPRRILEFQDEGISGKTEQRPGYQELLRCAFAGEIDTIIAYRLDRISRHANHAIKILLELDEVGVAFISVTQPVLNLGHENPFRRTMLAAFAEIAEIERETTVVRVKAGLAAAKKRGVILGPPRKVDDISAQKVRQLRGEGRSYRAIAIAVGLSLGTVHKLCQESG